jgi:hypothetical protein
VERARKPFRGADSSITGGGVELELGLVRCQIALGELAEEEVESSVSSKDEIGGTEDVSVVLDAAYFDSFKFRFCVFYGLVD